MKESDRSGYVIVFPNREKAASKFVKLIVTILLLASVVLMLLVMFGGWSKLQGLKAVDIFWCLAYLVLAFYVMFKWSRGALTMASALAIMLLGLALISAGGLAGTSWFQRDSFGYATPQSLFGGTGFSPSMLGFLTVLIAPVQLALIVFALLGMRQAWNIETEMSEEDARKRRSGGEGSGGGRSKKSSAEPAPA